MNYVVGDPDGGLDSVAVGMYNSTSMQYAAYERVVVWPGSTIEVPAAFVSGALWRLHAPIIHPFRVIIAASEASWIDEPI